MTQPTKEQFYVICVCGTDIGVIDPSLGSRRYLVAISNRYQENGLSTAQPIAFTWVCVHACKWAGVCCVCVHAFQQVCVGVGTATLRLCGIWFFCVCMFFHFSIFHRRRSIANNYPQTTEGIHFRFSLSWSLLQAISRQTNQCSFDWEGLLPLHCLESTRLLIMHMP